jgi:photosystem II stability/assembly factor-like uncharacterized protein
MVGRMTSFRQVKVVLGAVALIVLAAGCSTSSRRARPAPTSSPSVLPTGTSEPATTGSSTTSAPPLPVPAGFYVVDLTWVSAGEGWALGSAPCSRPPCTSIAHTTDGGLSWGEVPAPPAFIPGSPTSPTVACSAQVPCVSGIRFADANTGYLWGQSSLWMTTNGGRAWVVQAHDATVALEVAHGTVVRVDTQETGCPPGCTYQVEAATVGSTTWRSLHNLALTGDAVAMSLEGPRIYVAAFRNPAGGANDAHPRMIRSGDAGSHWTAFDDPCGLTPKGAEADAGAISAAPAGHFVVACEPRTSASSESPFVVTSADGAVTFGPHHPIPVGGPSLGAGPISAATGRRLALLVSTSNPPATEKIVVLISEDGGFNWHVTLSQVPPSLGGPLYLGFQDATTGRLALGDRTIDTTTDGGRHWTAFTFP